MSADIRRPDRLPDAHAIEWPVTSLAFIFTLLLGACLRGEAPPSLSSVYTDLSGSNCSAVNENRETGATVHRCHGVGGWDLLVLYDDQRMSVTAVDRNGKESPLAFWDTISRGFTSLGPRAEWRVSKGGNQDATAVAVIVRVNVSETTGDGQVHRTSYLAVAKLGESGACVTRRIGPANDANDQARRAADTASEEPCLIGRERKP